MNIVLMKDGAANSTIFVLGSPGSGKTQLIAHLIRRCRRFVIFDTRRDYDETYMSALVVTDVMQLGAALNKQVARIIFRLSIMDKLGFDTAMKLIYKWQEKNHKAFPPLTVSVDELNQFTESASWPENFAIIINSGRDYKIEKIFGAQWFGSIPTWVRNSITELYTFRHTDEAGINRLTQFGFMYNDILNLPQYNVLYWKAGNIKQFNIIGKKLK